MCHHYNKVVQRVYMFAYDEKLRLNVCLKVYMHCTKNHQTLTWRISKIIICSTLAFFVKNASVSAQFRLTLVPCTWERDLLYIHIFTNKIFNIKRMFLIKDDIQFRYNSVHLYNSHSQNIINLQIYQTSNTSRDHM